MRLRRLSRGPQQLRSLLQVRGYRLEATSVVQSQAAACRRTHREGFQKCRLLLAAGGTCQAAYLSPPLQIRNINRLADNDIVLAVLIAHRHPKVQS